MRQICNFVYSTLADGRSSAQLAELDAMLADPADRERELAKQNMAAMAQLGMRPLVPPKR